MEERFNLIDEPWIPCVGVDGKVVELGLSAVLSRAHTLREVTGESPLVTGALHRLLLAILHRNFGPASFRAWRDLQRAGRWNEQELDTYWSRWRDRFNLFDLQRPFYQASDERVKPKSVTSLMHHVASGNNATLFDHHTDEGGMTLTPAEAARALIAGQSFGLAGLSGLPQKFTDGASARGVLFLVQGDTLYETLLLNMVRCDDRSPMPRSTGDRPAWEMDDPFQPARGIPLGYLDYLTWQNRRILLFPEAANGIPGVRLMTVAPGLRLDANTVDPMKHYRVDDKRGLLPLRFNEARALWRDSATLLRLDAPSTHPPRVFRWLADLVEEAYLPSVRTQRTLALGMSNDQAKVEFYREEHWPLPLAYLDQPAHIELLEKALQMAEAAAKQLWGATRTLATYLLSPNADSDDARKPDPKDLDQMMGAWGVERWYWSRLEVPFRLALERIPVDSGEALSAWRTTLQRAVWGAFETAAGDAGADPRALKAAVKARDQLAAGIAKVLPRG